MTGQMSIWDFMQPKSLDDMSEEDMVRQVSRATGIDFKYRDDFWKWVCNRKGIVFHVHFANYDERVHDGRRFISAGWDGRKQGVSGPMDSVDEAINFFKRAVFENAKEAL